MTTNDDTVENSSKTAPVAKRLRRWLGRAGIALAVLIGVYVLFRILYPVWIDWRLPSDAPRIAFSLDNSLLGRIGITNATYQRVMTAAGGRLITLRPDIAGDPVSPDVVDALLDKERIDGVLLTGGGDVDPNLYGGDPNTTMLVHRLRDDFEIALIHAARKHGLPILGICRGCKIINVALGGTVRNLRKEPEVKDRHLVLTGHPVDLAPDSKLAEILGVTHLAKVVSLHGNAVGEPAPGVRIAATGPGDVIEAIEADSAGKEGWIIGIQWHPELTLDKDVQHKVYKILVDRARQTRLNTISSPVEASGP
jgi:putative glutamine amidotransferase